jgi:hypothetical protein
MHQLNRSVTIGLGVVGTLVMASGAVLARAIHGGAIGDTDDERRFESNASVSHNVKFQSMQPVAGSRSVRPPRQHLFSSSPDPFGFATPLGTLSALHPSSFVH